MNIQDPLFIGKNIRLAPIDHERDAEVESKWTHDPEYLRMLGPGPVRPLSAAQIKKKYEAIEKEEEEKQSLFYFTIRTNDEQEHLVGFVRLTWVDWTNSNAFIQLGIGEAKDRRQGLGSETLALVLRYAFSELNLYRLSAIIPEYNEAALALFSKSGFIEEVRRRQAIQRDGERWDVVQMGILAEEWNAGKSRLL